MNDILHNAERLREDAQLLLDHDRFHSATVLAIHSIEEIGKFLIGRWQVVNLASNRKFPSHIEKQAALFCLLSANEILKHKKRVLKLMLHDELNMHKVGEYSSQLAWARAGFFEDWRVSALCADQQPKLPKELIVKIDGDLPRDLFRFIDLAFQTVRNSKAMSLAAATYTHDLGRL